MQSRTNSVSRAQGSNNIQGNGPTWILVAGGALLSSLSVGLGFKLKQAIDAKQPEKAHSGERRTGDGRKSGRLRSNGYSYAQEDDGCFGYTSGTQGSCEIKQQQHNGQIVTEPEAALPLVTVPPSQFNGENGVMWSSSPDRLELPHKPFHHSNCSNSPSVSESGSDIFSKREVILKLRQQVKRRDDMIMEMQEQIVELQNSLKSQMSHSSHLQSLLDGANLDLIESEREIQRLRKAIADHCIKPSTAPPWPSEGQNGHSNGYIDVESSLESLEKGRGDGERIEMLKREVAELKEVLEVKEYLVKNYKEQKTELSQKVNELQLRLDCLLPNIL